MPKVRADTNPPKTSLEFRREAFALFIAGCKVKGFVQREGVSDAIEFWIKNFFSENDLKRVKKTDEYKVIMEHGANWKRHMPKKGSDE